MELVGDDLTEVLAGLGRDTGLVVELDDGGLQGVTSVDPRIVEGCKETNKSCQQQFICK